MGLRGEAPNRDEGAILSALRLIFKSYAFEPPFSLWGRQARMPVSERTERGTMPRKLSVHKGLGVRDREFALLF